MRKGLRRFISASLAVVILFTTATTNVFGGTPSEGGGSKITPGNFPGNGTNPSPVGEHGGVRVTVTNMSQAGEAGIIPVELGAPYTDAINQFNALGDILRNKVWWL